MKHVNWLWSVNNATIKRLFTLFTSLESRERTQPLCRENWRRGSTVSPLYFPYHKGIPPRFQDSFRHDYCVLILNGQSDDNRAFAELCVCHGLSRVVDCLKELMLGKSSWSCQGFRREAENNLKLVTRSWLSHKQIQEILDILGNEFVCTAVRYLSSREGISVCHYTDVRHSHMKKS